ncbi:unnamed protein product [Arctogadus glacialis]
MDVVQKALLSCTESLVLGHGHGYHSEVSSAGPQEILMASLGHLLLKDVKDLGLFLSLRICSLPDNFITAIDALAECVLLVKLDLKGNQIVQLPDALFWAKLGQLQLLNLHDNHMETIQNTKGLAGCPNLTGLTLYDTPFSLKGDYRCTVVCSVWSLRALDRHVISDQELASLHFPPKFKAFSPNLLVNLSSPSAPLDRYQGEIKSTHKILSEIHRIQATYCPILIIQRWIRGHLTRKRLGLVKAVPRPKQRKSPHATLDSAAEQTTQHSWGSDCLGEEEMQRLNNHSVKPRRITLNLSKLLQGTLEVSQIELPVEAKNKNNPLPNTTENQRNEPSGSPETVRGRKPKEVPKVLSFPMHCCKVALLNVHPPRDVAPVRQRESTVPRCTVQNVHSQRENKSRTSIQRVGSCTGVHMDASEKRWMFCPQGVLNKVEKDCGKLLETRAEIMKLKTEQVTRSLEWRQGAKTARQSFTESKRMEAVGQGRRERALMEAAVLQKRVSLDREVEDARLRHFAFLEEKKRAALEREMEREFSWRLASVSKIMDKYSAQQKALALRQTTSKSVVRSRVKPGSPKPQQIPVQVLPEDAP